MILTTMTINYTADDDDDECIDFSILALFIPSLISVYRHTAITSSVRLCVVAPTVNVHVADRKLKFKAG